MSTTTRMPAARPTYDDVTLILKLYDLRREARMREARRWFAAKFKVKSYDEFMALCPPGTEENASYRQMTTFYEMVASFLNSGVLNRELYYQSGREMLLVWERLRDVLPDIRRVTGNPHEYANLEEAAAAFIEWWNANSPGAYDAFKKRIRP